jgi:hydrogenase maturation protease
MSILVLGYGNPGRQDDGLGPAVASAMDSLGLPNVTAYDNYQLNIEDAMAVAAHDVVWFVDAAKLGPAPYTVSALAPAGAVEFTSHIMRPQTVLAIAQQCYGKTPPAFLLGVRGYEFEFVEALTPGATANLDAALAMLMDKIGHMDAGAP